MIRPGAFAIAACIAVVSASLSVVLFTIAGLEALPALLCGAIAAMLLALAQWRSTRARERTAFVETIAELRMGHADLAAQLAAVEQEMPALVEVARRAEAAERSIGALLDEALGTALDQRIGKQIETTKTSLVGEMRVIEGLVKQIVESQTAVAVVRQPEAAPAPPLPKRTLMPSNDAGTPLGRMSDKELLTKVRHAIAANRIDIFLQPIVTLPQRKVRFYEALVRLRDEDGDTIMPADYIRVAGPAGLMPVLDNLLLLRGTQIVKQMTRRNSGFKMFCNLAMETLGDPEHFPQFIDYLEQNRQLADHLVFEFGQADLKRAGPLELDSLAALREQNYRFSLDHVEVLDLDAKDLAQRGFKFVKVGAKHLLDGGATVRTHIHPADMSNLLSRYGIELIAEKVEAETEVVNLLDLDLSLGQGYLFAEPKQVRVGNANLEDLLAARKAS